MNVVECKTLYYILLLLQLLLFCVEPFGGEWEDVCFVMCLHVIYAMSIMSSIFTFTLFVYSSYISFDENLLGLDNKLQPYTFQTHAGEWVPVHIWKHMQQSVYVCVSFQMCLVLSTYSGSLYKMVWYQVTQMETCMQNCRLVDSICHVM